MEDLGSRGSAAEPRLDLAWTLPGVLCLDFAWSTLHGLCLGDFAWTLPGVLCLDFAWGTLHGLCLGDFVWGTWLWPGASGRALSVSARSGWEEENSWPGRGGPRRPRPRPRAARRGAARRGDGGGGGRGQPAADGGAGGVDVRGHVAGGVPGVAAVGVRPAPRVGPGADHRRGGQHRPEIQALRGRARGPPAGRAEQAGARAHEGRRGACGRDARPLKVFRGAPLLRPAPPTPPLHSGPPGGPGHMLGGRGARGALTPAVAPARRI